MANKVEICGINTATLPKIKNDELVSLMARIKKGDELAREEFIIANLRLVLSVVQRFVGKKEKADDMFQVGCVGLLKAIDNFDITLNVKFSTYAVPMIIGEIRRYLRDNNSIRVSRSLRDTAYKVLQTRDRLTKENNFEPTLEEIAKELDIPLRNVTFSLDAISDTISLNEPVFNDGNEAITVVDQVVDYKNSEDNLIEKLALKDALSKLGDREKEILTLRYFIGKTQMEVSDEVGISQAQVSRLEKNALDFIKKHIQ